MRQAPHYAGEGGWIMRLDTSDDRPPCNPDCEGYAVFNSDHIERCDECNRFADDDEAALHFLHSLYAEDNFAYKCLRILAEAYGCFQSP